MASENFGSNTQGPESIATKPTHETVIQYLNPRSDELWVGFINTTTAGQSLTYEHYCCARRNGCFHFNYKIDFSTPNLSFASNLYICFLRSPIFSRCSLFSPTPSPASHSSHRRAQSFRVLQNKSQAPVSLDQLSRISLNCVSFFPTAALLTSKKTSPKFHQPLNTLTLTLN